MRYPIESTQFALVRITSKLPIKDYLKDLLLDYQENAYFIGSEKEFITFTNMYGLHFRCLLDTDNYLDYLNACDIFYFDENELDLIGDLPNKKNWVMF